MKLLDVLTSPWAIQPSKLLEIQSIYATHLRGDKIDIAGVEKRLGAPLQNEHQGYQTQQGVAVLPVHGVIAKRMNLFSQISGGASTEIIARDLRAALDDPDVHSIILDIDSPGGTVDGTQALAQMVFEARAHKTIFALADGMIASAAYWIGSAASAVYITEGTTQVGSIGVVATHTDVSGAEQQAGFKTTEIYAGKYKRIDSQYAPLTDEGRRTIQDEVDYIYSIFVSDVAAHRGVSEERVLADMADGRIFIGTQAVDAGLVDGVSTLDALIATLNGERGQGGRADATINSINQARGTSHMNITQELIASEHSDIAAAFRAEGRAEGRMEGAQAERERIKAVEDQLIPGHEALIASLKYDGKTSGPEAAVAVLNAERKVRGDALARMQAEAPAPAPHASAPDDAPRADADAETPLEDRCKAKWDKSADLRAEFGTLERYTAFERASASGRVKVLGKSAA